MRAANGGPVIPRQMRAESSSILLLVTDNRSLRHRATASVSWLAAALTDCARQLLPGPPPRHEGNLAVAKTSERAVYAEERDWAACMVMRLAACTLAVLKSGRSSGIRVCRASRRTTRSLILQRLPAAV